MSDYSDFGAYQAFKRKIFQEMKNPHIRARHYAQTDVYVTWRLHWIFNFSRLYYGNYRFNYDMIDWTK